MIWSKKQAAFITAPFNHTMDVCEGTPRSSKTTACCFRFARHLVLSRDLNHLVVAASQEQAWRLVMESDGLGLTHIFSGSVIKHDENGDYLKVQTPNGEKKVYYKGGAKKDSEKAIRGLSLGSVFFCEIDILHPTMVQECLRRTWAAKDRWHVADLNPPAPNHPVINDVFNVQDIRWIHWTCKDNPILTAERLAEIEATCKKNPYLYKRDWLGERAIPQGVIYSMFDNNRHIINSIPADERKIEMYFTGDGGLADATSIGCYIVTEKDNKYKLYRVANWYYSGTDTGIVKALSIQAREICGTFIPWCRDIFKMRESFIKIDPACKALRSEMDLLGFYTDAADNNAKDIKGSSKGIKVGIEYLQNSISDDRFFVVDNEKYGHFDFLREIGMYCVDDNGNPVDAYNHAMDETRYAHNYFYKNYVL